MRMSRLNPMLLSDFYKTDHIRQYPKGTEVVYSNMTARASRMSDVNAVVVFGLQYVIKEYLLRMFGESFFRAPKDEAVASYKRVLDMSLGRDAVPVGHVADLHDLGYWPVLIKAIPEGTRCPIGVPFMTIQNTHPKFYWVTNFLETLLCNATWHSMTSATIADAYRRKLDAFAWLTSDLTDFVDWQGHDFSMRGHTSIESACVSGAAHLLSFTGTDTIPAIPFLEEYYGANCEQELIGGSVPATEHSVMCMGGKASEIDTYRRLITEVYPSGVVSIVSDTWDYWKVLRETLKELRSEILARPGKVVVRPDSGDPVKIICGDPHATPGTSENKGTVQVLWELFGGTTNSKGYKQLDSHIGVIYGDSITLDRCQEICNTLALNGFASTNMVFGIGSYTYQHVTRDTFGFAMKATAGVVNGRAVEVFKDPKTDSGIKRSAKGLLRVNEDLTLSQQVTPAEEATGLLVPVFVNGTLIQEYTLADIRRRLKSQ